MDIDAITELLSELNDTENFFYHDDTKELEQINNNLFNLKSLKRYHLLYNPEAINFYEVIVVDKKGNKYSYYLVGNEVTGTIRAYDNINDAENHIIELLIRYNTIDKHLKDDMEIPL